MTGADVDAVAQRVLDELIAEYGPIDAAVVASAVLTALTLHIAPSLDDARQGFAAFANDCAKLTEEDWQRFHQEETRQ